MLMEAPETLSPRESLEMDYAKAENEAARVYNLEMKRLELEVEKLQVRWGSLLRIPMTIIKLPLYILLGIAYVAAVIRKYDPGEDFRKLLK